MSKIKPVLTDKAPAPIGPYSQAVKAGGFLFCSGQVAIDPATSKLVEADVSGQTEQVLKNIGAILDAAGLDFSAVIKTTIFLADMADFAAVNTVYGSYFSANKPARSTVAVAGLPLGARVEIEIIALRK